MTKYCYSLSITWWWI